VKFDSVQSGVKTEFSAAVSFSIFLVYNDHLSSHRKSVTSLAYVLSLL
jgi:hypothetical protein